MHKWHIAENTLLWKCAKTLANICKGHGNAKFCVFQFKEKYAFALSTQICRVGFNANLHWLSLTQTYSYVISTQNYFTMTNAKFSQQCIYSFLALWESNWIFFGLMLWPNVALGWFSLSKMLSAIFVFAVEICCPQRNLLLPAKFVVVSRNFIK